MEKEPRGIQGVRGGPGGGGEGGKPRLPSNLRTERTRPVKEIPHDCIIWVIDRVRVLSVLERGSVVELEPLPFRV